MNKFFFIFLLALLCSCGPKEIHIYDDKDEVEKTNLLTVEEVISGDTILLEDGRKIKYIHLNAPQKGEPFFEEAKKANNFLVVRRSKSKVMIKLGTKERDEEGRYLAYVYAPTPLLYFCFVNQELIEHGYAKVKITPPNTKYLEKFLLSEENAKKNKLNIWK